MKLQIDVPDEFMKEFQEQMYGDMHYEGFNIDILITECLKEVLGMEFEMLRII